MRPQGIVRLYQDDQLLWEGRNLFVNTGLPALANLIAGVTAGQFVSAIGYGSGAAAPSLTDTGLTSTPTYYNAIGPHSFPTSGSVEFSYSLLTTDYAADGITIQELGLFANAGSISLPAAQGTSNPIWAAGVSKAIGDLAVDPNGNIERCTSAGTTGISAPSWANTSGGTTIDGTVTWTLVAFHAAPNPLIAHVVVPAFSYTNGANYSGTWTLTF